MPLSPIVANVLEPFAEHFGVELLHFPDAEQGLDLAHAEVSVHGYSQINRPERSEPTNGEARRWLEEREVMFSPSPNPCRSGAFWYLLAPIVFVSILRAYHVTTRRRWGLIQREGLLPGCKSEGRLASARRLDCEGNIFVSERLGTLSDAGVAFSYSAHWWRDHKAGNNVENDPDWVILCIDLDGIDGLLTYSDIYSTSGVIVRGVESIPPERIQMEYG